METLQKFLSDNNIKIQNSCLENIIDNLQRYGVTTDLTLHFPIYSFDDITKEIYKKYEKELPSSCDALIIHNKKIILTEFKSGFNKRIDTKNLDPEKSKCKEAQKKCDSYWNCFEKLQNKEREILIENIKIKLLESIITLSQIYKDKLLDYDLFLYIVIDEPSDKFITAMYGNEISRSSNNTEIQSNSEKNYYLIIKNALNRFIKKNIFPTHTSKAFTQIKVIPLSIYLNELKNTIK